MSPIMSDLLVGEKDLTDTDFFEVVVIAQRYPGGTLELCDLVHVASHRARCNFTSL